MSRSETQDIEVRLEKLRQQWSGAKLDYESRRQLEQFIYEAEKDWRQSERRLGNIPKVSVVMSVYNTERFVGAAIKSILDQTFKDFEIILIDDGSSDKSIDIVKSFDDPRIRIVHQTNHGLVYSFNKGVELARADIIARMDADDISLPRRLETELAWLEADKKRGLVGTFFTYMDEDSGKPLDIVMTAPPKHIDIVRMMHIVNPFGHGSILMRKAAVKQAGGYHPEYEPAEDYDLWRRISQQWEVGILPEVLYLWRFHPASISRRKSDVSNHSAEMTVANTWNDPEPVKSALRIIRDASYYKSLVSPLNDTIHGQYVSQQERLAEEYFTHGKLMNGYNTALALLRLKPRHWRHWLKLILAAPVKYKQSPK